MHSSRKFVWIPVVVILAGICATVLSAFDPPRSGFEPELGDRQDEAAHWRLGQPVTYETMTVIPVLSAHDADTGGFETLDAALASGEALVTEQGDYLRRSRSGIGGPAPVISGSAQVNQLVLVNRGKRPLLLLAGEVVSGGKQDRIIAKDRIVPVGAEPLPLDVFCVEHSRWTGSSMKFSAGLTMVHPAVREKAAVDQDQNEVWAAVSGETGSGAGAGATTGSAAGASPGVVMPR
ncbi:MAG: DUF6569 family protein, partial [Candidatus Acidiferrales bacterium]